MSAVLSRRSAARRHTARRAEGKEQCDRRADDTAWGLRSQSAETEADRAGLRLDEDRRWPAETAALRRRARRLDRDLHRSGLQPGPRAEPVGEARVSAARCADDDPAVNSGGRTREQTW